MRIGIDLLFWNPGYCGGMETYAINLLRQMARIDSVNEYLVFVNRAAAKRLSGLGPNFQEVVVPLWPNSVGWRVLYQQIPFVFRQDLSECELLHSMGNIPCLYAPCPVVLTVHDLIGQYYPKDFPRLPNLLRLLLLKKAAQRAWVITISENSKHDIIRWLRVPRDKLVVIPEACPDHFLKYDGECDNQVKSLFCLPEKYLLFVGRLFHYKNVPTLLESHALLRKDFPDLHVVLVGQRARGWSEIERTIQQLGSKKHVWNLGHVTEAQLPAIYKQASVFVFPSFYEGFGLPVLEAMACGVPVICSRAGSLPEVVGDAALLVNPCDKFAIANAIRRVLADTKLARNLSTQGWQRVQSYSWEHTARNTLEFYLRATRHTS